MLSLPVCSDVRWTTILMASDARNSIVKRQASLIHDAIMLPSDDTDKAGLRNFCFDAMNRNKVANELSRIRELSSSQAFGSSNSSICLNRSDLVDESRCMDILDVRIFKLARLSNSCSSSGESFRGTRPMLLGGWTCSVNGRVGLREVVSCSTGAITRRVVRASGSGRRMINS